MMAAQPLISVVVPTVNRSALLAAALDSLSRQTLRIDEYEVIVVDDGSRDETAGVCREAASRLSLHYESISPSGIAAAKNLGVFVARAPILLFFDDDDLADENLLRAHVRLHHARPEEWLTVLGHSTWSPALEVTPVMEYVTGAADHLCSHAGLVDGSLLDFRYFRGGRSSCKRSLLVRYGVFNQCFRFGCEDVELAYRLSRLGLKVLYSIAPLSFLNRPVSYAELCRRCERQGKARHLLSGIHPHGDVQEYCQVEGAEERWARARAELPRDVERVGELECTLADDSGSSEAPALLAELQVLYGRTFEAFTTKGIVEAMAATTAGR